MPRTYRNWTPYEEQTLREHHGKLSGHVLADRLGRSHAAIKGKLQRLSLPTKRHTTRWLPYEKDLILDLKNNGLTYSQIGNELGMTRNVVAGIIHRTKNS